MTISHQDARVAAVEAFKRLKPTFHASLAALQWAQGVAILESHYGSGTATNNWGSVQCSHGPPAVDGECVILTDSTVDGTPFQHPYRVYATPEDGAFGMLSLIWRKWPKALEAADNGQTLEASRLLYGYYTGKKPKGSKLRGQALRDYLIRVHAVGVYGCAKTVAKALDEKLMLSEPGKLDRGADGKSIVILAALAGGLYLAGRAVSK